jgi:DNA repair ATPase RecN
MTKSTLDRLTTLGEEVLGKASQNPNLSRVVQGATQLRDRVDELQKRVRGLEGLEKRLAEVEGRLAKLERTSRKPSATKKTDTKA